MTVEIADSGAIRTITLARPDRRNAMTPEMLEALHEAVVGASRARGVVLLGQGATFCSGFDLALCEADASGGVVRCLLAGLSNVIRAMRGLPVPVVVGVQGGAIAGGCALLGGADVVIAERGAKFGYPVVRIGLSPAVNAPSLHRLILSGPARRLMLDPGLVDAAEAKQIGLVHEMVESAGEVGPAAGAASVRLAAKPPESLRATKRWMDEVERSVAPAASTAADAALATSIALTGGAEERAMLRAALTKG